MNSFFISDPPEKCAQCLYCIDQTDHTTGSFFAKMCEKGEDVDKYADCRNYMEAAA
jgi:hypothetical protein